MNDGFACGRATVPVLFMDNHILVVEKPVNVPVQRDASGDMDLLTAAKAYVGRVFEKPGNVYLGLVHRLDRPVGGVMVFARTSKAAARLSKEFSAHEVEKRYLAVARPQSPSALAPWTRPEAASAADSDGDVLLRDHLMKNEWTGNVSVVSEETPGAKEARLLSRLIGEKDGLALMEIRLLTGRAHQIRVQHASRALPLWGDGRYGGGQPGEQIALWAWKLTFTHPTLKTKETFCSFPPPNAPWNTFEEAIEHVLGSQPPLGAQ